MTGTPYLTKPGANGTLYSFEIEITPCDPGDAPYKVRRWAYDAEHAAERIDGDPMISGDNFRVIGKVRA
jgi:hypothetical protein